MTTVLRAIDALRAAPDGEYADELVRVRATGERGRLRVDRDGSRVRIRHGLTPTGLDDDLAERLADALAPITDSHDVFARAFTGIVLTSHRDPLVAWTRFYRNSLARRDDPTARGYVEVYRHALELLPYDSVLDLGCSFGFLALHLAQLGTRAWAADTDAGALALLDTMAERLALRVRTVPTDGERVALADGAVDAVALLHVLEHVDAATGATLLLESLRIARHRVVVAVPYEPTATALFGHVRTLDAADLHAMGTRSGRPFTVHEHHGGWLVLAAEQSLVPANAGT